MPTTTSTTSTSTTSTTSTTAPPIYVPLYTSVERIEELCQISVDDSSVPKYETVLEFIHDAENEIVEDVLGSHQATNVYIDVPSISETRERYSWIYDVDSGKLNFNLNRGIIIPLTDVASPIIAITSLSKNDSDPEDAPVWEALTQWNGVVGASNYMLLKSGHKAQTYALWIYDDEPESGISRLKATYTYGHNLDLTVLRQWCTYNAACKTLLVRLGSNEPDSLSSLEGGDLGRFVPRSYMDRIKFFQSEMQRLEAKYWPRPVEFGAEVV